VRRPLFSLIAAGTANFRREFLAPLFLCVRLVKKEGFVCHPTSVVIIRGVFTLNLTDGKLILPSEIESFGPSNEEARRKE
jgi:hypothetical protein